MSDKDNADWRTRYDELAKCQTERAQAMLDRDNYLQHMRWTFNVLDDGDSNAPLVELARRMKRGRDAERKRGDTYRRRALALARRVMSVTRSCYGWKRVWLEQQHRADAEHARAERLAGLLRRILKFYEGNVISGSPDGLWDEVHAALAAAPVDTQGTADAGGAARGG